MAHQLVILGGGGRMGKTIARCVLQNTDGPLQLRGAVDTAAHPAQGEDVGVLSSAGAAGICLTDDISNLLPTMDVAIDFSVPDATAANSRTLANAGKALVIGTTGLTEAHHQMIQNAANAIPIIVAPNMSLGVNLLFVLAEQAAAALRGKGYDVEIIEAHHRRKVDAPSGTALGLGQAVARGLECDLKETAIHGREGITGERPDSEIGFHAIRGGDIVGDHTAMFAADGEIVSLQHRATQRDTFALGALRAAEWVVGKPAGLYSMRDVLGLS